MRRQSLLLLPLLASASYANPTNSYPLALQYPPVIQQGEPYTYTLPSDTFTSSSTLRYSTENLPDWLSFDTSSRTFSGTAPDGTDGKFWFQLVGTDDTGSTSVNSSLVVTNGTLPTISSSFSLSNLLASAGSVSSSNSLVLPPDQSFYIAFEASAFNGSDIVQYIAMTTAHTPLPIWINYDSSSLSFSGTTPTINSDAASLSYPLSIFAIQIAGFSSASLDFTIKVGAHQFTTDVTSENVTAIPGETLYWNVPLDKMELDNTTVSASNISNITVVPDMSWLEVNTSTLTLQGTVPDAFESDNVTVTVTNVYSDSVQIQLNLQVNSTTPTNDTIFSGQTLPSVNATSNEFFTYQLPSSALSSSSSTRRLVKREDNAYSNISVSYDPAAPWLTFTKSNLTFTGQVPKSFSGTTVSLVNEGNEDDKLTLTIRAVNSASTTSATSTPSSTTSSTPSSTTSSTPSSTAAASKSGMSHNKIVAIVCGTVIPVVAILLFALIFCCIKKRKGKQETKEDEINPEGVNATEKTPSVLAPSVQGGSMMTLSGSHPYGGYAGSTDKFSVFTANTNTPIMNGLNPNSNTSTPAKAAEFNLLKLDNPKLPVLDFEGGSPMSGTFSEASDATHVGEDGHSIRGSNNGAGAPLGMGLGLSNLNNLNNPLSIPTPNALSAPQSTSEAPENPVSKGVPMELSFSAPPAIPAGNSSTPTVPVIPSRATLRSNETTVFGPPGKPRNSWRQQSNNERRWHSRNKGGSLASIGTDELISVRMVDPTRTSVATTSGDIVNQSINRENSSPILRAIGDSDSEYSTYAISERPLSDDRGSRHTANSGSIGSYSSSEGSELGYGFTVPYGNSLGAIAESPNPNATHAPVVMKRDTGAESTGAASAHSKGGSNADTLELYRTASSGREQSSAEEDCSEDDQNDNAHRTNLQPVLRNGEWEWERTPGPRVAASPATESPAVGYRSTAVENTPVLYGQAIDSPSTLRNTSMETPQMGVQGQNTERLMREENLHRSRSQVRLSDPGGIRKVDEEDY